MIGYFFADSSIGVYAYIKGGKASFGQFEWLIIAHTLTCAILYVICELRKNFRPAVILNGIACMVAGIPLVVDSFRNPHQMSYMVCFIYLIISSLTLYGERDFNGKFIPKLSIGYWILVISGITVAR